MFSSRRTLNALAQVWSAPFEEAPDYNVEVAFRGFLLVFAQFLTPIQLKLCKTQTGCRYRALKWRAQAVPSFFLHGWRRCVRRKAQVTLIELNRDY